MACMEPVGPRKSFFCCCTAGKCLQVHMPPLQPLRWEVGCPCAGSWAHSRVCGGITPLVEPGESWGGRGGGGGKAWKSQGNMAVTGDRNPVTWVQWKGRRGTVTRIQGSVNNVIVLQRWKRDVGWPEKPKIMGLPEMYRQKLPTPTT